MMYNQLHAMTMAHQAQHAQLQNAVHRARQLEHAKRRTDEQLETTKAAYQAADNHVLQLTQRADDLRAAAWTDGKNYDAAIADLEALAAESKKQRDDQGETIVALEQQNAYLIQVWNDRQVRQNALKAVVQQQAGGGVGQIRQLSELIEQERDPQRKEELRRQVQLLVNQAQWLTQQVMAWE